MLNKPIDGKRLLPKKKAALITPFCAAGGRYRWVFNGIQVPLSAWKDLSQCLKGVITGKTVYRATV
jgi:hypothetical protein